MDLIQIRSLVAWLVLTSHCLGADLEWVRVADGKRSFNLAQSGREFVPWGLNYDHQDGSGRLIEDYWDAEWATVEEDFKEMKALGANVVRFVLRIDQFPFVIGT